MRTLFKTEPSALLFVVIKECCDFDRGKLRVRGEYVWGKLEIGCGSSDALLYIPKKAETFGVRGKKLDESLIWAIIEIALFLSINLQYLCG